MPRAQQLVIHILVMYIWILYLLAICANPGRVPRGFTPRRGEWRRWCAKCSHYKPERAHHCKTCNQCVLVMDHHCPWIYNCVGFGNMPHFFRFLASVIVATSYVLWHLAEKAIALYHDRNLPAYLIKKSELVAVIVLIPTAFFVWCTIIVLLLRCISNHIFKGMTQIETWEWERIESQFHTERMWARIRSNYEVLHQTAMPELESAWRRPLPTGDASNLGIVPRNYTVDDMVFPYDLGVWKNTIHTIGNLWTWLLPWGKQPCAWYGYLPQKSAHMQDDQLNLPWPPDAGHHDQQDKAQYARDQDYTINSARDVPLVRKRLDPRSRLGRTQWMNDLGETLQDFGVDVDTEDKFEIDVDTEDRFEIDVDTETGLKSR